MIVLLDKELADGSLSRNTCKLAEKVLEKKSPHTCCGTAQRRIGPLSAEGEGGGWFYLRVKR
jgi:hypothetical protein